jgi:flagellar hook-associated protein 2
MTTPSVTSSTGPLDVQGLVSQLMTVADQPLNAMNSQLQTDQSQISDYGSLSSDLTSLQSTLTSLSSGTFINTLKATSSNTNIMSATADNTANAGDYNVTVNNLATAQNLAFTGQASETASLGNSADTLNFTFGSGSTSSISIAANSSLDQIAADINNAGIGVAASVVQADNSATPYRLVLTGDTVGSGQSFSTSVASGQSTLSFLNFDASSAVNGSGQITDSRLTEQAQNASLTVNGLNMTSASNTVTTGILGVTMNLTQAGSTVLNVARDTAGIQTQVQNFVTAYNKLQTDSNSLYNGDLAGDFNIVQLQNTFDSILQTPISGANGTTQVAYLAQIGVSIQKDGTLSLDTTALDSAMSNNPTAVANVFGNSNNDGFAQRFNAEINNLLGPQGLITTKTTALNQAVTDKQNDITNEQSNLSTIQANYLSLYTNLNSSLAKMEQTSSSLANMISSA